MPRLPARAKITIEPQHLLEGYSIQTNPCPDGFPLTVTKLRRMFATYHVQSDSEYHDSYQQMGCVTEGDIIVDGKKYRYIAQPINNLITTWPDGIKKVLGGKHSADNH